MIQKIEKLMNSTCKEGILLAFHLVKHYTGIQSPVVIMWWIQRRCNIPWYPIFYRSGLIELTGVAHSYFSSKQINIYHSELE